MSPFGDTKWWSLSTDEIDALVAFIRSWEANPPADIPPVAPPAATSTPVASVQQPVAPEKFLEQVLSISKLSARYAITLINNLESGMQLRMKQSCQPGKNAPVVMRRHRGKNSLLAQLLLGFKWQLMPHWVACPG